MHNPYAPTAEPHYDIEQSAKRSKMPVGALVERIGAGQVETKFNGRRNYIAAGEIARVSAELRREAEAAQAAESETVAQEQRERDGAHIVREISRLRELAEKYGYDPSAEG